MRVIETFKTDDGAEYAVMETGAIKQTNPQPFIYDAAYSAIYDSPERVALSNQLQGLRYVFATTAHGKRIRSLTDVGYGNGAFMRYVQPLIPFVAGLDITDVPVPEGCHRLNTYHSCDVITFHDCLEHFEDISFVEDLPCETLVVSLPYCHYHLRGKEWFANEYFHRKPNEHVWHFSGATLEVTMGRLGWKRIALSNHEDIVRKRDPEWNILSMSFKRK
ncbi:hypothetical protein [Paraflavitalea pollutisoli]|uniref:hypothetical protein n=1 Tax=Paraflavitalea pollutisoli TaxID=3034143 RepID=UPI0023EB0B40|nr:hypothetical protein [Paraflavitalea sp. H1-2-19X]